jgi:hypothetical protein
MILKNRSVTLLKFFNDGRRTTVEEECTETLDLPFSILFAIIYTNRNDIISITENWLMCDEGDDDTNNQRMHSKSSMLLGMSTVFCYN